MRERAQTLLHFGDGYTAEEIAQRRDVHLDTVYDRREHWLDRGFARLADKHRSGAPSKVSAAQQEQLRAWASAEPLTARQSIGKLQEEFGITLHPDTLGVMLERMSFVWKRTRHSLEKNETP